MKKRTKLLLNLLSDFMINVTPYIVIVVMSLSIYEMIGHTASTVNIVILSVVMLIIRYLYHIYEMIKSLKVLRKDKNENLE